MPPKQIPLVRHAQGYHNLSTANHALRDPVLTPLGEVQCHNLALTFPHPAPTTRRTLVVASPLKRTLSTALLSFASLLPPERPGAAAILALPDLQETSDLPCDTGSPAAELARTYRGRPVDLSLVEREGDAWCRKEGRWGPGAEAIRARARAVREWLWGRSEEVVVAVTHGGLLHYLTEDMVGLENEQGGEGNVITERQMDMTETSDTAAGTGWENAEYRTYVFASPNPAPSYSLKETTQSIQRRSGIEKPLTEAEQRNLKIAAQAQKEQQESQKRQQEDLKEEHRLDSSVRSKV
ncbi:MAG: hypothetical protein M1821_004049 [Bathelium mastoideum]|nr:MAG: hypothetical protein M1821_004049 [Bathelium mastoideum]